MQYFWSFHKKKKIFSLFILQTFLYWPNYLVAVKKVVTFWIFFQLCNKIKLETNFKENYLSKCNKIFLVDIPDLQLVMANSEPSVYSHWLMFCGFLLAPNQTPSLVISVAVLNFSVKNWFFPWLSGCASLSPLAVQASLASNQFNFSSTSVKIYFLLVSWLVQVQVTS